MADLQRAAARLRREGPSVHHVLCDLRRPPVGPPKCTCRVSDVATAVADLLDAIEAWRSTTIDEFFNDPNGMQAKADRIKATADALAAAILRGDHA